MIKKGVKPAVTCLTKAYKHRLTKIGLTGGWHGVYRWFVPQHFGILQGYIGVSCLNEDGLCLRYPIELHEAFLGSRGHREVYKFLWKYHDTVKLELLQVGLTVKEAYALEEKLRPKTNYKGSEDYDPYNWNTDKGGKIPATLNLEKIEAEEKRNARK